MARDAAPLADARSWPKIVRDPIHSSIKFERTACDTLLLEIINTKEFQRLRRIKQLGMSELVFPGANHSRFAHSIGVMNNARKFVDRLHFVSGEAITEIQKIVVLVSALIHDVGHGPFSHTFEKVTDEDHEARTLEIIQDETTELHRVLKRRDPALPKIIWSFFSQADGDSGADVPAYLARVVSSQMDADRFDYLVRDSVATGAAYGMFDPQWLIDHMFFDEAKERIFLSAKGLSAAEQYIIARYHMYRTVYFHKTTRAAEVMLRLLFQRYSDLVSQGKEDIVKNVWPIFPAAFRKDHKLTLDEYLSLDDHMVSAFLRAAEKSEDQILQSLAEGLVHRHLFKAIDATEKQEHDAAIIVAFSGKVQDKLKSLGLDPTFAFTYDSAADTPYKPFNPDEENAAEQIYIEVDGKIREIGQVSEIVEELKKKYSLLRYYFPASIRGEVSEVWNAVTKKGK